MSESITELEDLNFNNRISTNKQRRKLKIVSQTPTEIIADVERMDVASVEGDKIDANTFNKVANQVNVLKDMVVEKQGTSIKIGSNTEAEAIINFASDPQTQLNNLQTSLANETSARISADTTNTANINNLAGNTTKIKNTSGGFSGGNATSATTGAAVGSGATATTGFAGGANAKATADGAIQLGSGTNTKANSLQIAGNNIYDIATNKITVSELVASNIILGDESLKGGEGQVLFGGSSWDYVFKAENYTDSFDTGDVNGNKTTILGSSIVDSAAYKNYSNRALLLLIYVDHSKNGSLSDASGVQVGVGNTSSNAISGVANSNKFRVARASSNSGYPKFPFICAIVPPQYYFSINWWGYQSTLNSGNVQIRFHYI